jgi:Flp pilus assembly protein TadD
LKGVMLADAGQRDAAAEVYQQLVTERPELPEPYNNLAVLYAAQGDFEHARAQLELALRASPGYAVAYQNLGDVYLQLARQAYQQALTLDPANATIPPRLAMLRNLDPSKAAAIGTPH